MFNDLELQKIATKKTTVVSLTTEELVYFLEIANARYRAGNSIITDSDYDFIFLKELQKREPNHSYLLEVEVEKESFGNKILLPELMLSTDKAYTIEEIIKFTERLTKSASEINLHSKDIILKATPKLDGFAAYDDGVMLYTRGDGKKGSDISRAFERGLSIYNDESRGLGAGEIVITRSYFNAHLYTIFEYPRSFAASIIKEKALDEITNNAIEARAAFFVPFTTLPNIRCSISEFLEQFDDIITKSLSSVDFDVDGVVIEAINPELKEYMGSNRKFHRWQIAYKKNDEFNIVKVIEIVPQVGRTGKITPVAILEPSILSGATITHATCHHYGMVKEKNLGIGSEVELVRSGQVIPKIIRVISSTKAVIPSHCPSCESLLKWQSDFLMCTNHDKCTDQGIGKLEYFFKILGNNDGFGKKTLEKLYDNNITTISEVYELTTEKLMSLGFGEKTSSNLILELQNSKTIQIEDYRFLSAFGIERLGLGNSENLLRHYTLKEIFALNEEDIVTIDGFADISAKSIVSGFLHIKAEFEKIYALGFSLEITDTTPKTTNIFSEKSLVFSGAMQLSREEMEKRAKSFGANIQKSVNNKTDYLIVGEKVGQSKLTKARELGVEILTEADYLKQI